jgi:SAM-dependent methyltransferase
VATPSLTSPPLGLWARSWPLPALLAWLLAWGLHGLLREAGATPLLAAAGGLLAPLPLAWALQRRWRRLCTGLGFPLSWLALHASQGGAWPPAAWLLAAAALWLAYPRKAWQDAPLFPTPAQALQALPATAALPAGATVLDAGCGLGHGLLALRVAYPQARLQGVEWSAPLAWLCRWRLPSASIRRGDLWAADWSACDLVYLFQRPESLPRALDKARREMRPGSWLVSLEFWPPEHPATARLKTPDGRPLWLWRVAPDAAAPAQGRRGTGR